MIRMNTRNSQNSSCSILTGNNPEFEDLVSCTGHKGLRHIHPGDARKQFMHQHCWQDQQNMKG